MVNKEGLLQQQHNTFTDCAGIIAPLLPLACPLYEAMELILNARRVMRRYPNFQQLKRAVLKPHTPDSYAVAIERYLRDLLEGRGNELTLKCIQVFLADALHLLESEMEESKSSE